LGIPVRYDTGQNITAPEQLCNDSICTAQDDCPPHDRASAATDRWQVGLVLLQLLTKKSIQQLIDHSLSPPSPLANLTTLDRSAFITLLQTHCSDTDPQLKKWVLDLLERDPSQRPREQVALATIHKGHTGERGRAKTSASPYSTPNSAYMLWGGGKSLDRVRLI